MMLARIVMHTDWMDDDVFFVAEHVPDEPPGRAQARVDILNKYSSAKQLEDGCVYLLDEIYETKGGDVNAPSSWKPD